MFKNIKKIIQSRRFAIPILGLVLTIGASAQRIQPVLSKQIARLQAASLSETLEEAPKSTWIESNPDVSSQSISKEARLRRVLDASTDSANGTKVSPGKTYVWMQGHNSSSNGDVIQDKTSTSTLQARVPEDKVSVRGTIPADNFPNGDGVFLYGYSQ